MIRTMMWVIIVFIILVLLMILVLKMTKKYHITWYWCQNIRDNMVEKKGQKIRAGVPPPPFSGNARKKTFFSGRCSLLHRTQPLVVEKILQNTEKLRQFPENNIAINTEQKISPTGSLERVTGVELLSFEQLECMLVERPVRLWNIAVCRTWPKIDLGDWIRGHGNRENDPNFTHYCICGPISSISVQEFQSN